MEALTFLSQLPIAVMKATEPPPVLAEDPQPTENRRAIILLGFNQHIEKINNTSNIQRH